MPKNLSDILKGVKKSTISTLTTGDLPGVDYADKMKDGRDFVAQHSIEKHADRVGNDDSVYKGATKKAKMERHGHEPKPKDIQVYNKTQQQNEEYELDETSGMRASEYNRRAEQDLLARAIHDEPSETRNRKIVNRAAGIERANKIIQKKRLAKKLDAKKKRLGEAKDDREYGYEGDMAITQLKTICRHGEHLIKMLKPDTDLPEWVQSKITKAEDYISTAHDYLMSEMNEEVELDETKKPEVSISDNVAHVKNSQGKVVASYSKKIHGSDFVKRANAHMAKLNEAKCNMSEAGTMCEVHGMKACPKEGDKSASDNEPRYNGKKKEGRQLITDKKLQEKLTKNMSAGDVISDFIHSEDPKFKGKSKKERERMALGAYYSMHPEKSKKVNESVSDQRSARSTASEKAREKIANALERKKLEKMKHKMKMEQSAPAETVIRMPSGNVGDTGRV